MLYIRDYYAGKQSWELKLCCSLAQGSHFFVTDLLSNSCYATNRIASSVQLPDCFTNCLCYVISRFFKQTKSSEHSEIYYEFRFINGFYKCKWSTICYILTVRRRVYLKYILQSCHLKYYNSTIKCSFSVKSTNCGTISYHFTKKCGETERWHLILNNVFFLRYISMTSKLLKNFRKTMYVTQYIYVYKRLHLEEYQ